MKNSIREGELVNSDYRFSIRQPNRTSVLIRVKWKCISISTFHFSPIPVRAANS